MVLPPIFFSSIPNNHQFPFKTPRSQRYSLLAPPPASPESLSDPENPKITLIAPDHQFTPQRSSIHRLIEISTTVLLTLILLLTSQALYKHLTQVPHELAIQQAITSIYGLDLTPVYSCGNNSTEAIAMGCIFDMSASGWTPPQCTDAELMAQFEARGWRFWEDRERTVEVGLDRIAASASEEEPREVFWSEPGFHENHCALMWERMHRAAQRGWKMTTHMLNFEHTRHCGGLMQKVHEFTTIGFMPLLNTC
ncbi:hypothetical protein HYFRA_00004702 [Hymenoscyphus fraxineus]|uniref:Uncharacterized protein n=1 Tax=Hymenoscyphus fraxineus TaxID=746836 RepID=A0A9N9L0F7_9HELO|nr:hypothetical protein HYFRA_00004702 [Hymenoscyphus fraxineus]